MSDVAKHLLSARRKDWFRSRPVFQPYAIATAADVAAIESRVGRQLPEDMRQWLSSVGFGDIDEALSFRGEWFQPLSDGELKGGFRFAQDDLGNFYALPPAGESVVFLSRSEPAYAILASSFRAFLEELERRDYKVGAWAASIQLVPYAWNAV